MISERKKLVGFRIFFCFWLGRCRETDKSAGVDAVGDPRINHDKAKHFSDFRFTPWARWHPRAAKLAELAPLASRGPASGRPLATGHWLAGSHRHHHLTHFPLAFLKRKKKLSFTLYPTSHFIHFPL